MRLNRDSRARRACSSTIAEYVGLIARDRLDLMKEGETIYRIEAAKRRYLASFAAIADRLLVADRLGVLSSRAARSHCVQLTFSTFYLPCLSTSTAIDTAALKARVGELRRYL